MLSLIISDYFSPSIETEHNAVETFNQNDCRFLNSCLICSLMTFA